MNWKEKYLSALDQADLFENSGHRTRFKELLDCYSGFPFFTKGLCKCIYLSAWDDDHFAIMLQTLTDMSLGKETDTEEMRIQGEILAREQPDTEYCVYQLSIALLTDAPFDLEKYSSAQPEIMYIMKRALEASVVIDQVEE